MMARTAPQISVIVPCYNIEGYVGACLDSLAAQSYTNFEVLCIDDGSSDATGKLLDKRADKDSRFRSIHQTHTGPALARGLGFQLARTPLICFVDGDDVVSPYYLETLLKLLKSNNADIACCSHRLSNQTTTAKFVQDTSLIEKSVNTAQIFDTETAFRSMAKGEITCTFWGKLFRRTSISTKVFSGTAIYEDLRGMGRIIEHAKRIVVTNSILYCYVMREGSLTHTRGASLDIFWNFQDALVGFEQIYARALKLEHATDDSAYCQHLVKQLCTQHGILAHVSCSDALRSQLSSALREELAMAYRIARVRGISLTHPQMIRAALLLRAPRIHDFLLDAYHQLVGM